MGEELENRHVVALESCVRVLALEVCVLGLKRPSKSGAAYPDRQIPGTAGVVVHGNVQSANRAVLVEPDAVTEQKRIPAARDHHVLMSVQHTPDRFTGSVKKKKSAQVVLNLIAKLRSPKCNDRNSSNDRKT